jgi:HKD family nuclease
MTQKIELSGIGTKHLRDSLRLSLIHGRPRVIGVVAAFVSTEGIRQFIEILKRCGEPKCRLIAGTDNAITHPEALFAARDQGWKIRLGKPVRGIFHPKLVVAGQSFSRNGTIQQLCCVYVGSSNLTNGGLNTNVECGLISDAEGCLVSASEVFAELWETARPATDVELRNYAARFAERARRRAVSELADLGVTDSRHVPTGPSGLRVQRPPSMPAIGAEFAVAAWAGLQSFTGEYRFQVEFPKSAGKVINQLIRSHVQADGRIDVYCPDDETTRPMQYKFYQDNSMFRLNVPNDVPGVEWAREHKDGLAIVEQGLSGGAPLRIRLLKPGADANEIVSRSAALGTWGKTSTRSYGWY